MRTWHPGPRSRVFASLLALVLALVTASLGPASPRARAATTAATPLVSGHYYTLQSVSSGQYVSVAGGATADATPIVQDPAGSAPQQWRLGSAGGSAYNLTLSTSGQCVDVNGASKSAGAAVIDWTCNGAANEAWTLTPTGNGAYTLVSANSGLCLDDANNSQAAGNGLIQWTCTNGANQQWPVPRPADTASPSISTR